jgi:hypothetical protein
MAADLPADEHDVGGSLAWSLNSCNMLTYLLSDGIRLDAV